MPASRPTIKTLPCNSTRCAGPGASSSTRDKASGVLANRKGLTDALKDCAAGDVLVVWKLDRLARSLHDLVVIAADLKGRGVGLKILTGEGAAVDTTHPQGRMIFGILAVMAEFERELMSERTVAGMAAAKRRGRHVGRPRKVTAHKLATVQGS